MEVDKVYQGHVLDILKTMPDESIDCVVTSPPYWGLRDYGDETKAQWPDGWVGQLGHEPTFDLYLDHLIEVFREIKRVMKKTGTCWINLGDSYAGSGKGIGSDRTKCKEVFTDDDIVKTDWSKVNIPSKSLCLIPFRFAMRMVDELGFILRNTIIWYKPNAMPSSAKDRFTVDFEYVFFFVKNKNYYFEQQLEPFKKSSLQRFKYDFKSSKLEVGIHQISNKNAMAYVEKAIKNNINGRNMRTTWTISTKSFHDAHFAVFPETLVERIIKAGCPEIICNKCGMPVVKGYYCENKINTRPGKNISNNVKSRTDGDPHKSLHNSDLSLYRQQMVYTKTIKQKCNCNNNFNFSAGIVLDPFIGSGTTAVVANRLNRNWIGIEINPKYVKMVERRCLRWWM